VSPATCNDCRTLLGGYVLHALEPDETEAVRRHLATCEACESEHGRLMAIPALLDLAGGVDAQAEQPPAALEEAVLDRFAREAPSATTTTTPAPPKKTPRRKRLAAAIRTKFARPLPAALAGALVAAALTAAVIVVLPGGTEEAEGGVYKASLAGSPELPAARASATLEVLSAGTRVSLSVRGLGGKPDSVYELWCIRDDGVKISAGTFRTDSAGRADVDLTTAAVPGEYHRLSIERKGLSRDGQAGERVMTGSIQYPHW
jgi:Anti-sigma-K factor rskA, C-terminal/Putative zinc-finger